VILPLPRRPLQAPAADGLEDEEFFLNLCGAALPVLSIARDKPLKRIDELGIVAGGTTLATFCAFVLSSRGWRKPWRHAASGEPGVAGSIRTSA